MQRLKQLEELFLELDGLAARALHHCPRPVSCKRGCDACCHMMTSVLTGEGLLMARELAGRLDWRYRLRRLARAARAGLKAESRQEYLEAKIPCPFLEKGECAIYECRPTACRYYYVVSPAEWCGMPSGTQVLVVNLMEKGLDLEPRSWELQERLWGIATAPLPIMVLHCLEPFMKGRERERELRWALKGVPDPRQWMHMAWGTMKDAHDTETEDVRRAILASSRRVGLLRGEDHE